MFVPVSFLLGHPVCVRFCGDKVNFMIPFSKKTETLNTGKFVHHHCFLRCQFQMKKTKKSVQAIIFEKIKRKFDSDSFILCGGMELKILQHQIVQLKNMVSNRPIAFVIGRKTIHTAQAVIE